MRPDLGEHELSYLVDVRRELRGVPVRQRRPLLDQAGEHLSERPPAGSDGELTDALGMPDEYAAVLRTEAGLPARFTAWQRLRWQRRWSLIGEAVILLVAIIGMGAAWTWFTAVPEIRDVCASPLAVVETSNVAGPTREFIISADPRHRVGIEVCPFSDDHGVEIDRIRIPILNLSPIQPVGFEFDDSAGRLDPSSGIAGGLPPFRPAEFPWGAAVMAWFEVRECDSLVADTGNDRVTIDHMEVGYRYHGRHRNARVDLGFLVSFRRRPCTDDSPDGLSFADALPQSFGSEFMSPNDSFGPLDLSPENIGRDLCRYLRGIPGYEAGQLTIPGALEPLENRAVFDLGPRANKLAEVLIDTSLRLLCPEFADRRDELVAMIDPALVAPEA